MSEQISALINLESILTFSSKLNESYDTNFILSSAMLSLMGKLKVSKICSFLNLDGKFVQVGAKGINDCFPMELFEIKSDFEEISLENPYFLEFQKINLKFIIPLKFQNILIGFIALSESIFKRKFNAEEIEYAKIIVSITSSSIENALKYESILKEKNLAEKKNLLLTTLMEISQDFSNFSSVHQILKLFSFHIMGQLLVNKYAVFIKDKGDFNEIVNRFDIDFEIPLLNELENCDKIQHIDDLEIPIAMNLIESEVKVIVPIIYRKELKGFVFVGKKLNNEKFNQENLLFLDVLSNTLIAALENNRLFQEEIEKKKIESELNLALEIQKGLLPKENPIIEGYDIFGISKPSRAVGGDYFDFIRINQDEFLIIIGDVSGKGVPAALLMANLQAGFRTLTQLDLPLEIILRNVNNLIYRNTSADKFVTLFLAKLNKKLNTFEYINAGHNPPILIQKNEVRELLEGGIVLGILDKIPVYGKEKIILTPSSEIFFYTDGLSEATNQENIEFGTERIFENLEIRIDSAELRINSFLDKLKNFFNGIEQNDDITMISLIKK